MEGESSTITVTLENDISSDTTLNIQRFEATDGPNSAADATDYSLSKSSITFTGSSDTDNSGAQAQFQLDALTDNESEFPEDAGYRLTDGDGNVVAEDTIVIEDSPGSNFTFTTTDGESFSGTSGSDTFEAPTTGRLQGADVADGLGGEDSLTARLNSDVSPTLTAIETFDIEATGGSAGLDGANITGLDTLNVDGGNQLSLTNADQDDTYNLSGDGTGLSVNTSGSDTDNQSITFNLQSGDLSTIDTNEAGSGGDFDQVTLNTTGATSVTLDEDTGSGDFVSTNEDITVEGDNALTLSIANGLIGANNSGTSASDDATIDASNLNGEFTLDIAQLGNDGSDAAVTMTDVSGLDALRLSLDDGGSTNDERVLQGLQSGQRIIVNNDDEGSGGTGANDLQLQLDSDGNSDSATVELNHETDGSSIDFGEVDASNFESVTVDSTGTDTDSSTVENEIGSITTSGTGNTLNITGDKKFTVAADDGGSGVDTGFDTIVATNATAGVDLAMAGSNSLDFSGSANDDRLDFGTNLTSNDTLAGGDGEDIIAIQTGGGTGGANSTSVTQTELDAINAASNFDVVEDTTGGSNQLVIDTGDFDNISGTEFSGSSGFSGDAGSNGGVSRITVTAASTTITANQCTGARKLDTA